MGKNDRGKTFENILLESIDEAFASLGENVKKAIYFHLMQKFLISREDIPDKIDAFSDGLEKIFGIGARNLEILIMASLHEKVRCFYNWNGPSWLVPNLTFSQYVEFLRVGYEDNQRTEHLEVIVVAEEEQEQRA